MEDLALIGGDDSGTIGSDETGCTLGFENGCDSGHVMLRNALRNRNDKWNLRCNSLLISSLPQRIQHQESPQPQAEEARKSQSHQLPINFYPKKTPDWG